jgi:hypothetical protein
VTAKDALKAGNDAVSGERLRRFKTTCGPRRACRLVLAPVNTYRAELAVSPRLPK